MCVCYESSAGLQRIDNVKKHFVTGKGLHGSCGLGNEGIEDFMGANAIKFCKSPAVGQDQHRARLSGMLAT